MEAPHAAQLRVQLVLVGIFAPPKALQAVGRTRGGSSTSPHNPQLSGCFGVCRKGIEELRSRRALPTPALSLEEEHGLSSAVCFPTSTAPSVLLPLGAAAGREQSPASGETKAAELLPCLARYLWASLPLRCCLGSGGCTGNPRPVRCCHRCRPCPRGALTSYWASPPCPDAGCIGGSAYSPSP